MGNDAEKIRSAAFRSAFWRGTEACLNPYGNDGRKLSAFRNYYRGYKFGSVAGPKSEPPGVKPTGRG